VKEWGSGVEGEMSEGDSGYPIQITHVIHVIHVTHCDTHDSSLASHNQPTNQPTSQGQGNQRQRLGQCSAVQCIA
jgi:hypothetical protein